MIATLFDPPKPAEPPQPSSWRPRAYQTEAVDRAFELFGRHPGVLIRLATGMGKTATAGLASLRWLEQSREHRVLVLAHERQLVRQLSNEFRRWTGHIVGVEMAAERVHRHSLPRIVVASRQTLFAEQRLAKFDPSVPWLVIVDEAHRYARKLRSVGPIIEHFEQCPESRRLGMTATPERTDKTSLANLFPSVAVDFPLRRASEDGWAVPYDQRFIQVEGVDFRNIAEVAGDYSEEELERILLEQKTLAEMCTPMLDLVGSRKNLVFTPTVAVAETVATWINAKVGRVVATSLSGADKERHRQEVFDAYSQGELQHLVVCGLCREGFDEPSIAAVTILRPTKSRPLSEQMRGRGCRPLRGTLDGLEDAAARRAAIAASVKPDCMVIDLVGATGLGECAGTLEIYADGKPDEVVERARQKLLDGETDVAKAVEDAERDIEAEREEQRRQAEERRRRQREEEEARTKAAEERKRKRDEARRQRQEEMNDRARLQADVTYTQHRVGRIAPRNDADRWAAQQRMTFGKHRGQCVEEVPAGYLRWALDNQPWLPTTKLGRAIKQHLEAHEAAKTQPAAQVDDKARRIAEARRILAELEI